MLIFLLGLLVLLYSCASFGMWSGIMTLLSTPFSAELLSLPTASKQPCPQGWTIKTSGNRGEFRKQEVRHESYFVCGLVWA